MSHASLLAEERETMISWCDDDTSGKIWIHTTQMPMVRRLLKNPLFELECEHKDQGFSECHGVDGYLPRSALTIRTKKVKRVLTDEQRKEIRQRFVKGKERLESLSVQ